MPKSLILIGKTALLCAGIAVAGIAALLLARSAHFCASAAYFNVSVPPTNVGSYLMRRLSLERICNLTDFFSAVCMFLLGVTATLVAWHWLREKNIPNKIPQP